MSEQAPTISPATASLPPAAIGSAPVLLEGGNPAAGQQLNALQALARGNLVLAQLAIGIDALDFSAASQTLQSVQIR